MSALTGLAIDGGRRPLPERTGLLQLDNCSGVRIADCEIVDSGRHGIMAIATSGEIAGNRIAGVADVALHSLDARGLLIARNTIFDALQQRHPGLALAARRRRHHRHRQPHRGDRQPRRRLRAVRQRHQRVSRRTTSWCAATASRTAPTRRCAATPPPTCRSRATASPRVREVALYAEFGFEGAVIANNTVDGAAIGVSVTNFNEGGRLAVVQGNLIRNLLPKRAGRQRSERRRRRRHRGRGRHRGHRQRDRGRAHRRHRARLRPVPARRGRHRQRRAQGRYRHRRVGGGRRRHMR